MRRGKLDLVRSNTSARYSSPTNNPHSQSASSQPVIKILLTLFVLILSLKFASAAYPCDTGDNETTCTINSTKVMNGSYSFVNLIIGSNGTLTHTSNSNSQTYYVNITAANISIESGGKINVTGKGYGGGAAGTGANGNGTGGGSGPGESYAGGGGGGHGGNGGQSQSSITGGKSYGNITNPVTIGSGGGGGYNDAAGGAGGGLILITVTGFLDNNGTILARGNNGVSATNSAGGGGAGGGIYISASTFKGTGAINASGGNGGTQSSRDGGGGAGGRVAIYYTTNSFTGTITATGGIGNDGYDGGAGTTYLKSTTETYGGIIINNNDRLAAEGITNITDIYTFSWVNITNNTMNGTSINITNQLNIIQGTTYLNNIITGNSTVLIQNSATLSHTANIATQAYTLNITCTDLTIESGATIDIAGKGYSGGAAASGANGSGPGNGTGTGTTYAGGGGAGHGGQGGQSQAAYAGGKSYGNITNPTTIGSGGGGGYTDGTGGAGGGLLSITASGTITTNGTITANGNPGTNGGSYSGGGGGAGGTIYINTGTITGNGTINASGGGGGIQSRDGGAGAGGRIAIHYTTNTYTGTIQNTGGIGNDGYDGGAGTTYLKSTTETYGGIIINNNDRLAAEGITNITETITLNWANITNNTIRGAQINITNQLNIIQGTTYLNNIITGNSTVLIQSGATLSHSNNAATQDYTINITCTDLTIENGATINITGKGYTGGTASTGTNGNGPCNGTGTGTTYAGGGGAGHGGNGGQSQAAYAGGNSCDNLTNPTQIGSGGGGGYTDGTGGAGGGLLSITASGTITTNGTITANGNPGTNGGSYSGGGGGAGGTIYINTGTITGNGTINASGGGGGIQSRDGGAGAGGRIAIHYTTNTYTGTIQNTGGIGNDGYDGGAGTTYLKSTTETYGGIIINNNDRLAAEGITNITETITLNWANITNSTIQGTGITGNPINITDQLNILAGTTYLHTPIIGTSQVLIQNGATLTHTDNTDTQSYIINITCNNFTLESGALINTTGKGYAGSSTDGVNGSGPGGGVSYVSAAIAGGGAGHGGESGDGGASGGAGGPSYDSITQPTQMGSGGGKGYQSTGGDGGGLIIINATGTINITGQIIADGNNGTAGSSIYGAGGGSGGSIYLIANTLTGSGNLTANAGGGGDKSQDGGGGAGGRIAIHYTTNTFTGSITNKGNWGYEYGGAGTTYLKASTETYGGLIINNYAYNTGITNITTTQQFNWANITNATINGTSINITDTLNILAGTTYLNTPIIGTSQVNILNGATLTHTDNTDTQSYYINITCNNLTIETGGNINTTGKGYTGGITTAGNGPGAGTYNSYTGGGAGHGGNGGTGYRAVSASGGPTYDSITTPTELGSGGGGSGSTANGGDGGGLIIINATNTINITGNINANGINGTGESNYVAGGGSGGSIYLITNTFTGTGNITSNGGKGIVSGTFTGGGGAGGRISIYYTTNNYTGGITATGNSGYENGGAGTTYLKQTSETYGGIIINNNDKTTGVTNITETITLKWANLTNATIQGANITANPLNITDTLNILAGTLYLNTPIKGTSNITVQNGATLTHTDNTNTQSYIINITCTKFTLESGGNINTTGKGYTGGITTAGNGPGAGTYNSYTGGGAGHGGNGGTGYRAVSASGGPTYDSITTPTELGSGGGGGGQAGYEGGDGGGLIIINATNTINITGNINADGLNGTGGGNNYVAGGGSGGSIYLLTNTFTGTGNITSNGGKGVVSGTFTGGGGAGGRIALNYITSSYAGGVSVQGGLGYVNGSAGTIFKCKSATGISCPGIVGDVNLIIVNPNASINITRNLLTPTWNQSYVKWNDTSDTVTNFTYNILGLMPGRDYEVYNYSTKVYALLTDADGLLSGIYMNSSSSQEIIVQEANQTSVRLNSPVESVNLSSIPAIFNCTAMSNYELNNITLYLNSTGWYANETIDVDGITNTTTFSKNLPDAHYTWNCYACDSAASCFFAPLNRTLVIDTILPNVTLMFPQNLTVVDTDNMNFTYNVNDTNLIWNCSLIINNVINQTNWTITQNINQTFNFNTNGNFNWSVNCTDQSWNTGTGGTFQYLDTTPPTVTLLTPTNNTLWEWDNATFVYNVSDVNKVLNCSLIINDAIDQTESSITKNTNLSFTKIMPNGYYNWTINCTDRSLNTGTGGRYNLTVNDTTPPNITIINPVNNSWLLNTTQWVRINITTDENSTCKYNLTTASFDFNTQGTRFNVTGGKNHTFNYTGLTPTFDYNLYYKCNDSKNNINPDSIHHQFSIAEGLCDRGNYSTTCWINSTKILNASLTLNNLIIESNGTLTHGDNTNSQLYYLNITCANLTIEAGGMINTTGKGYGSTFGPGSGANDTRTWDYGGGGAGHGGIGGAGSGGIGGGITYGSITQPTQIGSGGGYSYTNSYPGGSGGGLIIIQATETINNNGTITADGAQGYNNANGQGGGGSGGSIYLTANDFTGTGTIQTNGGKGGQDGTTYYGGGGAGGRIAIYYTTNTYTGSITATGGPGYNYGGAGTTYLKSSTETYGGLIINNNAGQTGITNITETITLNWANITNSTIQGNNIINNPINITDTLNILPGTLYLNTPIKGTSNVFIQNGATLTHTENTNTQTYIINISCANLTIEAGGMINTTGKGYGSTFGPGAGANDTRTWDYGGGGATHGGTGGTGSSGATPGTTYDSITNPTQIGSGGGYSYTNSYPGGAGGGLIIINATNTINITGTITANGKKGYDHINAQGGGGSAGSIWLTAGNTITGTGNIETNGGDGGQDGTTYRGGAGGAGRISINYLTNTYTGTISNTGGTGYTNGGAGTTYLKSTTETYGGIIINNQERNTAITNITETITLNWANITNSTIQGNNIINNPINITDTLNILPGTLYLNTPIKGTSQATLFNGATLTHTGNTNTQDYIINITCTNLTVQSGGLINTTGKGYIGGREIGANGSGPCNGTGISNSANTAGGGGAGHGGIGGTGQTGGAAGGKGGNSNCGNITNPTQIGSGGGVGYNTAYGGNGGGLIIIQATGTITNNGTIETNGNTSSISGSSTSGGGGAGGSIYLTTNTITGTGQITSNGGNSADTTTDGGAGAGGRIAIYYNTNTYTGTITNKGGNGNTAEAGGAGTTYLKATTENYGTLIINNYEYNTRITNITETLTLNYVNLTNATIFGNNINITDTLNIQGTLNLNNIITGTSQVNILNGATLTHTGNTNTQSYIINISCVNLTIEAGGMINTTGKGYTGGYGGAGNGPGNGTYGSDRGGGGAGYGGNGANGQTGTGGSTYESVTIPYQQGSGGGGANCGGHQCRGGSGGGLIIINATNTITINGTLTSNGQNGEANHDAMSGYDGAGGSGAAIYLTTMEFKGNGTINANGGSGNINGGGGAGGRIAIYYTTNAYTGTITATGGTGYAYGGAGTTYLKQTSESYGGLIINNNAGTTGITNITETITLKWANLTNATIQGANITANPLNITDTLNILAGTLYLNTPIKGTSNITVQNGATLTHTDNTNTQSYIINITCTKFTLESGGNINTTGKGYTGGYGGAGNGPGNGTYGSDRGGGGAGYGGNGSNGQTGTGGVFYGSRTAPNQLGSGGGGASCGGHQCRGGDGGGFVIINAAGTINITGNITHNGAAGEANHDSQAGWDAAGASGGSIYLTAHNFSGTGVLTSNGGTGNTNGGGGAGGRIALIYTTYCNETTFITTITNTTTGGNGYSAQSGGNGTIFYGCTNNPPSVIPFSPDNDSSHPLASLNISWIYSDPNNDPQWGFNLVVDNDSDFSSPEFDIAENTTNSSRIVSELNSTTYYWKVKVLDNDTRRNESGAWSEWSTTWQFIIVNITINSVNASPNHAFPGQNINITANITGSPIDTVRVLLNGTYWPMSNGGSGEIYWNDSVSTLVSANHTYTVFANDSSGNEVSMDGSVLVMYMNISLNLNPNPAFTNKNVSISGRVNQSDGTNVSNNAVHIYINNTPYYQATSTGLLEGTAASWWNTGWTYHKQINISENNGTNLTNFPVNITVDTQSLISANKLQSSCQDLRFTDNNGNELAYWIESGCNTSSTIIWIKANLTASATNSIYAYYGNSGADAASNGTAVFYFFDDFSADLSQWSTGNYVQENNGPFAYNISVGYNTPSVSNGVLIFNGTRTSSDTGTEDGVTAGWFGRSVISQSSMSESNFIIEAYMLFNQTSSGTYINQFTNMILGVGTDKDNYIIGRQNYDHNITLRREISGTMNSSIAAIHTFRNTTWYRARLIYKDNDNCNYSIESATQNFSVGQSLSSKNITISFSHRAASAVVLQKVDWVLVRKYSAIEPSQASTSNERVMLVTDSDGNYNYTWSTATAGNYEVKVNTTYNGMNAETTSTLTIEESYINISLDLSPNPVTASNNVSIYGHVNDTEGTNVTNNPVNIYINNTQYFKNSNTNLLEANNITWWNTSFSYRAKINITSLVSTSLNNTIVLTNLSTSDLISQGKMQSYCNDTRFTDTSGNELQYTLETSTCNTANTIYWIWTNLTGNANNTIYAYYGNSAATLKTDYTNPDYGLAAYYHLDNSTAYGENSTKVYDFSKNGNNGTISGASYNASGKYGGVYQFDGSNDFINISDSSSLRPGNTSWTISLWAKPPNINQVAAMVSKRSNTVGVYEQYAVVITGADSHGATPGKKITVVYIEDDLVRERSGYTTDDVVDGNWHHIVAIADQAANDIIVYVDGVEKAVTLEFNLSSWPNIDNTDPLRIGNGYGSSYYFNGSIDEVRIYNRSLSSDEILAIYNSTSPSYIQNHSLPRTDNDGNYNYTLTAPNTAGNYTVKVNTTYNGMSAEATGTLIVQSTGGVGVNCTSYKCFIIRSSGNPIAIFDALGAVDLKGTLTTLATGGPDANDFIIRNSTGSSVFWVDDSTGNAYALGSLSENNGVACSPPAGSFFIRGNNSECVAYVNSTGDLWLKGDLRESVLT